MLGSAPMTMRTAPCCVSASSIGCTSCGVVEIFAGGVIGNNNERMGWGMSEIPQETQEIIWKWAGWTDLEWVTINQTLTLVGYPSKGWDWWELNQHCRDNDKYTTPPLHHNILYELVGQLDEVKHEQYVFELLCSLGISDFVMRNYKNLDRATAEQRAEALAKVVGDE